MSELSSSDISPYINCCFVFSLDDDALLAEVVPLSKTDCKEAKTVLLLSVEFLLFVLSFSCSLRLKDSLLTGGLIRSRWLLPLVLLLVVVVDVDVNLMD